MIQALHRLSPSTLRALSSSFRDGLLSSGVTSRGVLQVVEADEAAAVLAVLEELQNTGWSPGQLATLTEVAAVARAGAASPDEVLDLVLSGPEVPGIPTRDTAAVMHTLIERAEREVILVGYAVHNGRRLFERLAERMRMLPGLRVWFCLNIARNPNDTSLSSEIVRRFAMTFISKHWPWEVRPEVYYDPRALDDEPRQRTSLHAKCLIVDRAEALITSANFTEAAQQRNIEAGVIIRHASLAERLTKYLEGLRSSGRIKACDLPPGTSRCVQ